jgi:hypothetical protein
MGEHGLIIRGGTVVDGTGAPARTADIAIDGGVVTEVGRIDGGAARTIDADGLLVTPGFVDIHAHYDGQASWDERMIPSSWHGDHCGRRQLRRRVRTRAARGSRPAHRADGRRRGHPGDGAARGPAGTGSRSRSSWTLRRPAVRRRCRGAGPARRCAST